MGERERWSPGVLFREVRADPDRILFRYPARTQGLLILLGAAVFGVAAGLIALPLLGRVAGHFFTAVFWLPFTLVGIHRMWTVRALEIDLVRRELALVRRTPLGRTREAYDFSALEVVSLEERRESAHDPAERDCDVAVQVGRGPILDLGWAPRPRARDFVRRLSDLTGAPLRIEPPGPRGIPEDTRPI